MRNTILASLPLSSDAHVSQYTPALAVLAAPSQNGISQKLYFLEDTLLSQSIVTLGVFNIFFFSCIHPIDQDSFLEKERDEQVLKSTLNLAQNHLDQQEPGEALELLTKIPKTQKEDPRTKTLEALSHLALSNPKKAKLMLKEVYDKEGTCFAALNYSSILLLEENPDEGISILERCLKSEPEYENKERVFHNLGLCYEKKGNQKEALTSYQKAIFEKPTYYPSVYKRALILLDIGQRTEGIAALKKAHSFCVVCFEPIEKLVTLYEQAGAHKKAKKLIDQFLKNEAISQKNRQKASHILKKW